MTVKIHTRNIPSDSNPEIVWAAHEKKTDPSFIERPGFRRCPRCKRCWPEDHFKAKEGEFPPFMAQSRCLDCRKGANRALRNQAVLTGICEARNCESPIVEQYKCARHVELMDQANARRLAEKLASK